MNAVQPVGLPTNIAPYLRDRFIRGDMLLFTGAGFSRAAVNRNGNAFPLLRDLRPQLWDVCYPGIPVHPETTVSTLFATAKARAGGALRGLLNSELMASPTGVPPLYDMLFDLPWRKVYTLNVDNIDAIVGTRTAGERRLRRISALRPVASTPKRFHQSDLDVVHLNGIVEDGPGGMTFSMEQYADRLAQQDPFYIQCAADIAAFPAIFIGTLVDESPLWQHMRLRERGVERAYRKRSFLVSPDLEPARAEMLHRELGIEHVPMDIEQFAQFIAAEMGEAAIEGRRRLMVIAQKDGAVEHLTLVSDIVSAAPAGSREYLLGARPTFSDIRNGRTAARETANMLASDLLAYLSSPTNRAITIISGTAGSGKTTCLMQAALKLDSQGIAAAWVDAQSDLAAHELLRALSAKPAPIVVFIDDADAFGIELPNVLGELNSTGSLPMVVLGCRSVQTDRLVDALALNELFCRELAMGDLSDSEIRALITVLDRENRLGVLKGLDTARRVARFKEKAGRQLIVAMLEATSGRLLRELLVSELDGLEGEVKTVYALVALSTALGFGVSLPELLVAVDGKNDRTHRSVVALETRLLIVRDRHDDLRVRHFVIAQVLLDAIISDGALPGLLHSLAIAFASAVGPMGAGRTRAHRRMRRIMNHSFLFERLQATNASRVYQDLESFLSWDSHYWLQRGSFELEHGMMDHAENFLGQAISLAPGDNLCKTEFGYLRLKQAVNSPSGEASRALLKEGCALLEDAIKGRKKLDPHQYHILGKQILNWTMRGDVARAERVEWLAIADSVPPQLKCDSYHPHTMQWEPGGVHESSERKKRQAPAFYG